MCVCVRACVRARVWMVYLSIFKVVGVGFKMCIFYGGLRFPFTYMCFFVKEVYTSWPFTALQ